MESPYFQEFLAFSDPQAYFGHQEEDYLLLASYYISRKIEDLIFKELPHSNLKKKDQFQNVRTLIFENEENKIVLEFMNKSSQNKRGKQHKDRKTSFFRTILKHLKQVFWRKAKRSSRECGDVLYELQEKLSKNTISNEDINELLSKYGESIVSYLESSQVYKDILHVNKSRVNKAYYLLHLKEICIEAKNGRLIEYPFFIKWSLTKEIENISFAYFCELIEKSHQKKTFNQKQRKLSTNTSQVNQEHFNEELFCVLNLENLNQKYEENSREVEEICESGYLSDPIFSILS